MTTAQLLTPAEVAQQLQVPVATLYGWRTRGKGPEGIRVGKHLRYRQEDLDTWLDAMRDTSSDEIA